MYFGAHSPQGSVRWTALVERAHQKYGKSGHAPSTIHNAIDALVEVELINREEFSSRHVEYSSTAEWERLKRLFEDAADPSKFELKKAIQNVLRGGAASLKVEYLNPENRRRYFVAEFCRATGKQLDDVTQEELASFVRELEAKRKAFRLGDPRNRRGSSGS
jgi:hypothetical protein